MLQNMYIQILYDQIWLNCLMNDRHFSCITKLKKKNPAQQLCLASVGALLLLAIYSQNVILKIKSAKIMFFFGDFLQPEFFFNLQKKIQFLYMVQVGSQNYKRMFKKIYSHIQLVAKQDQIFLRIMASLTITHYYPQKNQKKDTDEQHIHFLGEKGCDLELNALFQI